MRALQLLCIGFAVGVLLQPTAKPNGQTQTQIQNQQPNPTALTWGNSHANGLQTGP